MGLGFRSPRGFVPCSSSPHPGCCRGGSGPPSRWPVLCGAARSGFRRTLCPPVARAGVLLRRPAFAGVFLLASGPGLSEPAVPGPSASSPVPGSSPGSSFRPALRPVLCGAARSGVCVCLCVFLSCLHVCVCALLATSSLVSHVVRVYSYLVRVTRRAIGPLQTHAIWQHGETWCPVRGVGVGVSISSNSFGNQHLPT